MKDDQELRELLRKAVPDASAPQRFGAAVWQRIQTRSEAEARSGWRQFFGTLFALRTRPAFAAFALLVSVGAAAGLASLRASDANARARTMLVEQHVATIDPYARLAVTR